MSLTLKITPQAEIELFVWLPKKSREKDNQYPEQASCDKYDEDAPSSLTPQES